MNELNTIESVLDKLERDEEVEIGLLAEIAHELAEHHLSRVIPITAVLLPHSEPRKLKVSLRDTLHTVMMKIAADFREEILPPPPLVPLDELFIFEHGELKGPLDLATSVFKAIARHKGSRKFALKLNLSIKVNAQWKIAPKESMTPREILGLFDMDPSQFTLYLKDSPTPLPIDTALKLKRGECFDAMKDGRYGGR